LLPYCCFSVTPKVKVDAKKVLIITEISQIICITKISFVGWELPEVIRPSTSKLAPATKLKVIQFRYYLQADLE
jgi:hypothetical protein